MRRDGERLLDILSAIKQLDSCGRLSLDELERDARTCVWIAWHLQIIGEAIAHLSTQLKNKNPDVPWRELANVRHRIVHEYFALDAAELLAVLEKNMPELRLVVQQMIEELHLTDKS